MEIRNDIIRGRIGNYTEVLDIVEDRLYGLDSGVNRMRGVDTVKHVAFMGGDCNYVVAAKLTKRLVGKQIEISCQHNNGIIVVGRDEVNGVGDMYKQIRGGIYWFGGMVNSQNK